MSNWPAFWHIVVWASMVGYFGLGVVISIGGFGDVRKMLARLKESAKNQP